MNHRFALAMPGCKTMRCLFAVVLVAWLTGCGGGRPSMRMGCLPFPGPLTFFLTADPGDLGTHHASGVATPPNAKREWSRGVIYTCRAGFLDMAHIRNAIDWARYNHSKIHPAIAAGEEHLMIKAAEGGQFHITFNYPDDWATLSDEARAELVDELALRAAQQVTLYMADWHEMLTWFGYASWIIVPESGSAFTYEDVPSHLVGARVADIALRRTDMNFNQAVTEALDAEMQSLGAVTPKEARQAIHHVQNKWWEHGYPIKRLLAPSLPGTALQPWIVPDFEKCADASPTTLSVVTFQDVVGRDMRGFMHVEIEPKRIAGSVMRARLKDRPKRFIPEVHYPQILDLIRGSLIAGIGPDVDKP